MPLDTFEVLAIIQARTASTRLPRKVLLQIGGQTILSHTISRVAKSKLINEVMVATTLHKEDLPIVRYCATNNIRVFCGSEGHVLDRFYQVAKIIKPKHLVRITADCPLLDYKVIDQIVATHLKGGNDYTSNTIKPTYPDGQDVEIFKYRALEKSWQRANHSSEIEHITQYIVKHPRMFSLKNVAQKEDLSSKRWTIDNREDFEFVKEIFRHLYRKNHFFGMSEILKLLQEKPDLEKINQHFTRNEGLTKSLKEDKIIRKE